ncbi:MAG: glycoside hydrolase family 99-like domain-containing protein [Armatimonadota bacterium]|nr:MAG: glycoside hydrolase family 99-like domain-containing protein [Armatimonadota bacterium]
MGAIRWDAWSGDNEWEKNLAPKQWRHRLPFYSRVISDKEVAVRADTQEVMDQEIAYAHAAGLDYWAYCYSLHDPSDPTKGNYALGLHLASKRRDDVKFALILMAQGYWGPKDDFPQAIDAYVRLFREPNYQTVLEGRPLVYIFYVEKMPTYFGSEAAVREALDQLRRKSVAAGLKPPYIAAQVFNARVGAEYVDTMGFDAISAYASADFSHGTQEYPYRALADANRAFWESCKATGKRVIPIVSAGWDNRPRRRDPKRYQEIYKSPPRGPWYTQPTPVELADNLRAAVEWNRQNPDCADANAVIIYAWNESDEGGWLVPTKAEGNARLEAIKKVLKATRKAR